jgi:hypothetical protein
MMADGRYWKLDSGIKTYYEANKKIGDSLAMVKYLMAHAGISSTKAHKIVDKIKKFEG